MDQQKQDHLLQDNLDWYARKKGDKIPSVWFRVDNVQGEDKDRLEAYISNDTNIRRILKELLRRRFAAASERTVDLDAQNIEPRIYYDAGYKAALQDIFRLL